MRRLLSIATVAALCAATAHADAPKTPPKRASPIYDGRPAERTSGADVLHTAGRVVLFPAWLVVNYGIRWPFGKLVTWAEGSHGVRHFVNTWFLGPPSKDPQFFPIAFYDFGFQSSLGVRMLWENGFATKGSKFSLKLGFGGRDFYRGDVNVRLALAHGLRLWGEFSIRHRDDQEFFGIGSRTPASARARYADTHGSVLFAFGWNQLNAFFQSAANAATVSHFNGNASIEDQVAAGKIDRLPTGYDELLISQRAGVRIALDSRSSKVAESGGRFDAKIERVHNTNYGDWTHYDIRAGGALKLDKVGEHLLDIHARLELIEAAHIDQVPFMELAGVGGTADLRGFGHGRGRDASSVELMVDYQWPLAAWLDATLYAATGNVFGENLGGFYAGKLRGSLGLGLALAGITQERQIELWSALGFEPFDQGIDVSNFRLVLGYSYDY
ncbi:MAG TPA: hypothetical protein VGM39_00305 [Kofleriaceae bacterium]|jgi:hypothetical protein